MQNNNYLRLSASEWAYLIENLIHSSEEQRNNTREYTERITQNLNITETETGFVVMTDLIMPELISSLLDEEETEKYSFIDRITARNHVVCNDTFRTASEDDYFILTAKDNRFFSFDDSFKQLVA